MAQGISKHDYKEQLQQLQIQLVHLQADVVAQGKRVVVLFEGRDAAGKDGTIRRITRYLNPRVVRSVALGKPTEREQTSWYFQRYVPHLPAGGEIVLFNRSWYNRAGVERVMGFTTAEDYEIFMEEVPRFEQMLIHSGIDLFKFYLDIDRKTQAKRLEDRVDNPLKRWKISSIDAKALDYWDDYTVARDLMLARTSTPVAPWTIVRADDKKLARLNTMRYLLTRLRYAGKADELLVYDPAIVFPYQDADRHNGLLSR